MASFVQSNSSFNSNTAALTGVGAGNLIVLHAKWENSKNNISATDGTTSLSLGTRADSASADGVMSQFAYLLVANSGNITYTVTFPAGHVAGTRCIVVMEFSYTGTMSLDVQNVGNGNSSAPATGTVTTTGTDEVACGGVGVWTASQEPITAMLINAVAAGGSVVVSSPSAPDSAMWYRLLTATFSGGTASCTLDGVDEWSANIITLKAVAAGGLAPRPLLISQAVNRAATY